MLPSYPEPIVENLSGWLYGCDVCQDVCPWNRFEQPKAEPRFTARDGNVNASLPDILELTPETLRRALPWQRNETRKTGGSPTKRTVLARRSRYHNAVACGFRIFLHREAVSSQSPGLPLWATLEYDIGIMIQPQRGCVVHACNSIAFPTGSQPRWGWIELVDETQVAQAATLGFETKPLCGKEHHHPMKPFLLLALILIATITASAQTPTTPADLRRLADDYYRWRNQNYPVASSDSGLHTWDNKLTDYSLSAILARRLYVKDLFAKVDAMQTKTWAKDDRIDWLLFRSQLDGIAFFNRVMDFEAADPQTYVNECSNGIFSLLKKEYDAPRVRGLAATARLEQMPFLIEQGKGNLIKPVQLYAQLAIDSARSIDSLFTDSLMTLTKDMSPSEKVELVKARDAAIASIHGFADVAGDATSGNGAVQANGRSELQLPPEKHLPCCRSMRTRLKCLVRLNLRDTAGWSRCFQIPRWQIQTRSQQKYSERSKGLFDSLRESGSRDDRLP